MKTIVLLVGTAMALSACSNLYPGLTFGACAPGDQTHHTAYDLAGIAECVPGGTASSSHNMLWLD
jgi:hypothetical protein